MNSKWLVATCLLGVAMKGSLGYNGCTDTSLNYQGYTYTIDPTTQQKVWSHCGFPNPSFDYALCGLTYTSGEHFLCDPDGLLSSQLESKNQLNVNWNIWKVNWLVNLHVCHLVIFQLLSAEVHRFWVNTIIETFLVIMGYKFMYTSISFYI